MSADLESVRAAIDVLDAQIVALIAERQQWVERAGRLKADRAAVPAPARVEQVVAKVRALAADGGADPLVVERTYRAMIAAFIELELGVHERDRG
jgi:isochorismate pyruvate lyase